ncbi:MAG: alkaline phosphatase PhoX, partial [Cytophagales bacterium]
VEIGPDGKIYFTSKGNGRVYRFSDNGTSVSNFETYVGGRSYTINYGSGSASTPWGSGNDNLAFDDEGNLWVNQDGGNNHLWVVRAGHTQTNPKVELFAKTPAGCESTGLTFTPDFKFMFLSFQHPSSSNGSQLDASGASVSFNAAAMAVIARKEFLGTSSGREDLEFLGYSDENIDDDIKVYPVPFENELFVEVTVENETEITGYLLNQNGLNLGKFLNVKAIEGENKFVVNTQNLSGAYFMYLTIGEKTKLVRLVSK